MIDPRVRVLPWDGYAWSTYRNLEAEGHLWDVEASSWQERMSIGIHRNTSARLTSVTFS